MLKQSISKLMKEMKSVRVGDNVIFYHPDEQDEVDRDVHEAMKSGDMKYDGNLRQWYEDIEDIDDEDQLIWALDGNRARHTRYLVTFDKAARKVVSTERVSVIYKRPA